MINVPRIETVWHTGWISTIVMVVTFVFTLFAPLQWAVGFGVLLHAVMFIYRSADTVHIKRIVPQADGTFREDTVPSTLPSEEIVVLLLIGSLILLGPLSLKSGCLK